MKADKKESIIDIQLTQIDANQDWYEAQRTDPIVEKIVAAKEEDKRPKLNITRTTSYKSILGITGQLEIDKQVLIPSLGKR